MVIITKGINREAKKIKLNDQIAVSLITEAHRINCWMAEKWRTAYYLRWKEHFNEWEIQFPGILYKPWANE
jgi:hypothetical protein